MGILKFFPLKFIWPGGVAGKLKSLDCFGQISLSFSTQTLLKVGTVTQLATLSVTSLCKFSLPTFAKVWEIYTRHGKVGESM